MAGRNGKAQAAETPTSPSQRPPMPPRPTTAPAVPAYPEDGYDDAPPSYEDAIAEDLGPVDGPRRAYNPPDASASGTQTAPGLAGGSPDAKGTERLFPGSAGTFNASVESFDMLPSTPTDSHSSSANLSPTLSQAEMRPFSPDQLPSEQPPKYQSVQLSPPPTLDSAPGRRSSHASLRMNLGVPHRKPVPGQSDNAKSPSTPGV